MKVLIAPDSFKESLDAPAVAQALAQGWCMGMPGAQCIELPVADGGEGTTQTLVAATGGMLHQARVEDPLGRPVDALWGELPDGTAVIECASASGLALLGPHERDPWCASTFGTGQLIKCALDAGARRFIIGLGGSATNDGGAGMLQALGLELVDQAGGPVERGAKGLARLSRINADGLDKRLMACEFQIACDVNNPLVGQEGASAVFGPQKGASPAMVERLDRVLATYASCVETTTGKAVKDEPGAGAAGGLGAAFLAFFPAQLKPGIDIVLDAVQFDQRLQDADLVLTGEGRIDRQSVRGKTIQGVARHARAQNVPCIAVGGSVPVDPQTLDLLSDEGIAAVFPILPAAISLEQALSCAAENLRACARNLAAFSAWGQQQTRQTAK
ncbi:glycerate kinase [Marinobacterium litorale]|uniref:glycerate kinase family protein n=1 Tax=Marinobacterium litorale TaxID=404770 RepID=UPI00041CC6E1|nr:glycerate kinase [Marinobacterium litorale]